MISEGRKSIEEVSKEFGFVSTIEEWAKKHKFNIYVATYEHKEVKEEIVSEIKRRNVSSVLDLGCGYGFLITRLNEACSEAIVVGADISRFQIENARSRNVCGPLVVCCAEYIPFKDGVFECVVCSEVIEHVISPKSSLLEMERTLKTGGYLCISTDNPLSIYRRIERLIVSFIGRKKRVKEEYIPLPALTKIIPNTMKIYKIRYLCPYPLLPSVGFLGSEKIGRIWVSLGKTMEKLPHMNTLFCNKYLICGTKRASVQALGSFLHNRSKTGSQA